MRIRIDVVKEANPIGWNDSFRLLLTSQKKNILQFLLSCHIRALEYICSSFIKKNTAQTTAHTVPRVNI